MGVLKLFNPVTQRWEPQNGYPAMLDAPGAKVYRNSSQNIPTATTTPITFDTVIRDSHGYWNAAAPTRLTVPQGMDGWYLAVATGVYDVATLNRVYVQVRWNGTTATGARSGVAATGLAYTGTPSVVPLWMGAGDYVEEVTYHEGGADRAFGATAGNGTATLSLIRLGGVPGPPGPAGANGAAGADGAGVSPTGSVHAFAGSSAPSGWLLCDGAAVSRSTYATLFALIGTTYGVGDNSTTFNVPDMKGRVLVGFDSGQTEFNTLGETGGTKTETPSAHSGGSVANEASHTHSGSGNTGGGGAHQHLTPSGVGTGGPSTVSVADFGGQWNPANSDHTHTVNQFWTNTESGHTHSSGAVGAGSSHGHSMTQPSAHSAMNNIQPYITLNYIIKT